MTKKKIDEKKINGKIHKKIAKKWRKFVLFEFPVLFDIKTKDQKSTENYPNFDGLKHCFL